MQHIHTLSLVGYGRLARTIVPALLEADCTIVSWHVRNVSLHDEIKDTFRIEPCTQLSDLKPAADLCLLMVPDSVIQRVAGALPKMEGILAHLSGATPVTAIKHDRSGRFYPLDTFNGSTSWSRDIPLIVQSEDTNTQDALKGLARRISDHVPDIDEDKMASLHLAAVFAQNFSNHFIDMAERILDDQHLDRRLIQPLLHSMLDNLKELPAGFNQTGPAVRQDETTLDRHRTILAYDEDLLQLYQSVTHSIQTKNTAN